MAPYLYSGHATQTRFNLRSTNRRNDMRLIPAVLAIESAFELSAFDGDWPEPAQAILGCACSRTFFIGTVLPTMVLIYAILLPRYRLRGRR